MAARALLTTYVISLCYAHTFGLRPNWPGRPLSTTVADVLRHMNENPSNMIAQVSGCSTLNLMASHDREGPGPFGGRRAATKYLDAGIGEALAQGALNILSNAHAPDSAKIHAAEICIASISMLTVQNDYEKGVHLFEHGGPLIWKAFVTFDTKLGKPNCRYAGLYGTPQPEEAAIALGEAGGYAMILEQLEKSTGDAAGFQMALCALSDNVNSGFRAAAAIANAGGPLHGIAVLTRVMPLTLGRHFQEGHGFGLQYEMVHDTVGLLWHDTAEHAHRNEFYRLGYLDNLMAMIVDDPADAHLQDNCCQAIYYLTRDNATILDELANAGAIPIMAKSIRHFAPQLLRGYCTVVHSCSTALLNFAHANSSYLGQIKQLGIREALTPEVLQVQERGSSNTPTAADFQGSKLVELKTLLE